MANKKKKVETVHEKIMALDTEKFLKMNLRELCELREKAEPEDLRKLDYIMKQADLKEKVRDIIREELVKLGWGAMSYPEKKVFLEVAEKELEKAKKIRAGTRP